MTSELKVTLPIFTEVNGTRYELGTVDIPVSVKVSSFDKDTLAITGDVGDPWAVADHVHAQIQHLVGH